MALHDVLRIREITPAALNAMKRVSMGEEWLRDEVRRSVTEEPDFLAEGGARTFKLLLKQTGDMLCLSVYNEPGDEESMTGTWVSTPADEDERSLAFFKAVRDGGPEAMETFALLPEEVAERIEDLETLIDD